MERNLTLTYTSEASGPPGAHGVRGKGGFGAVFQSSPAEEPTSHMSLFPPASSPSDSMPSCSSQPCQGPRLDPLAPHVPGTMLVTVAGISDVLDTDTNETAKDRKRFLS